MLTLIVGAILVGLVVGALARLALPGRDPMSIPQTILVGIGGSLLASVVVYLFTGELGAGWLASLIGATLIVYLIRRRRGGGLTSPGRHDPRDSLR